MGREGRKAAAAAAAAKSDQENSIDNWLPITSSRNAKWWYSAFHNVTAMVGAGVLSLPYAMSHLGWGPGVTVMVLSWIITLYTLWQMVQMHEMPEKAPGKRFDRYHELGQYAFGEKLGLWIVVPQQLLVEVGVDIVYMVTGGKSLKKFHDLLCPDCKNIKLTYFIMIFGSVHFVLAQLPNFNSISAVSLAAAVMSLSYSTIAWVASGAKGKPSHVGYSLTGASTTDNVFNFFNALGDVAFAFAGHNVVLEIQATIPSTPDKPSKKPMWKGVIVAYIIVAICYLPVAWVGYYIFGNNVDDNILITLEKPKWLIAAANMFVVVHVIGSYQIYAMPVFDMIETLLVKKLKFPPGFLLRFIARTAYVAFTMIVAISFPFFGGLLGFFGGFAFAPTTYFLPCIMWLAIKKPKKFGSSWLINWICIVLGVILMILSPIGGLRSIILSAKDYKFFS
ncbi:Lysine histidine transporter 1 [Apostasia shenzhenica]|uniref:Lysine histidine transporter 1 n=1 Tax=Apostasia shenzhenica TaxID=1088818 RepID=A0A2I0BFX6_9ASPA|nr:Lysine histidine transporter 1 [Apostasia shenzhenica]